MLTKNALIKENKKKDLLLKSLQRKIRDNIVDTKNRFAAYDSDRAWAIKLAQVEREKRIKAEAVINSFINLKVSNEKAIECLVKYVKEEMK